MNEEMQINTERERERASKYRLYYDNSLPCLAKIQGLEPIESINQLISQ
jgi:hypothetical protein